jgi:hypothetical protein
VLRVAVVAALAAILTAVFAPIALADTLCDLKYGSYCCNQTAFLRLVMTYKSQWYSEKDYVAYRYQSNGVYTYRHFRSGKHRR